MNPLYLILGVAAVWYLPTLISVLKLDVSIKTFFPTEISAKSITFDVGLLMTNNSSFRVDINAMNIDVILNGTVIGTILQDINVPILAGRAQVIPCTVMITPDNLGAQLWQEAINQNLQNFVFEFAGTIKANNKTFPFRSTWTIKDFVK